MKKILIFGDSNTWGDNFITKMRIPEDKQWVNILKNKLGDDYVIFQEGLPGRLCGDAEKTKIYKNGKLTFLSTYRTCSPVDYVIIALGTNDLQLKYNCTSKEIFNNLEWYKNILISEFEDEDNKNKYFYNKLPKILYILPINFDYKDKAKDLFDVNSENERLDIYKKFKDSDNLFIFNSDYELFDDGIHLNYDGHKKMAQRVYEVIKNEEW